MLMPFFQKLKLSRCNRTFCRKAVLKGELSRRHASFYVLFFSQFAVASTPLWSLNKIAVGTKVPLVSYIKCVLGQLSDSRTSYIASVTISASANNVLSWKSYKKCFQCCHDWWMCITIMARNGHQRALNQLNKCFFGTAYTCPLGDIRRGNIWCARIRQLSKDFWDTF